MKFKIIKYSIVFILFSISTYLVQILVTATLSAFYFGALVFAISISILRIFDFIEEKENEI